MTIAAAHATLGVMELVRTIDELQRAGRPGENAFVPTMGALHEGHLSLIRLAAASGRPVVVSIFVNPTQFAPHEDFDRYPRTLEADVEAASHAGADVIFAPERDTVYPPGEQVQPPPLPAVAQQPKLEDAYRPGHFEGVCQVVARLFDLIQPRIAVFGEKDYQQLLVIRAMVESQGHRWRNLEIVSGPTVRESDGLAMSSRNAYLSPDQRERALGLYRALRQATQETHPESSEAIMREVLRNQEAQIEYAVVRDASTLMPVASFVHPTRALVAAHVDDIRLIDNLAVEAQP